MKSYKPKRTNKYNQSRAMNQTLHEADKHCIKALRVYNEYYTDIDVRRNAYDKKNHDL